MGPQYMLNKLHNNMNAPSAFGFTKMRYDPVFIQVVPLDLFYFSTQIYHYTADANALVI